MKFCGVENLGLNKLTICLDLKGLCSFLATSGNCVASPQNLFTTSYNLSCGF